MQIELWILIVGGVIVMFFGYFFGLFEGRNQGYKKGRTEAAATEDELPAASSPAAAEDDPGLLRLRESGGRLHLELEGASLDAEKLPAEQRKRLIETLARLRPWVEVPAVRTAEIPAPPPAPPAGPSFAARTPPLAPPQEAPVSTDSMVAQIDEILQRNILSTPLEARGLRLVEVPGGGVAVLLDHDRFASIGEVTDPQAQAAIRAAISLWEKKYTPGG